VWGSAVSSPALLATILIIFLRMNGPNFVHFISDVVLEDKNESLDLCLGSSSLGLGLQHFGLGLGLGVEEKVLQFFKTFVGNS